MEFVIFLLIIFIIFENFQNYFEEWYRSEEEEKVCADNHLWYFVVKEQKGGAEIGVGCGTQGEGHLSAEGNDLVEERDWAGEVGKGWLGVPSWEAFACIATGSQFSPWTWGGKTEMKRWIQKGLQNLVVRIQSNLPRCVLFY